MNKKANENKTGILIICGVIIGLLLLVFLISRSSREESPLEESTEAISSETEETTQAAETEEAAEEETTEEETETVVYPEPGYDFKEEEITVEIPNLDREYRIAWVSDVHLISDHEPGEGVQEEYMETIAERYEVLPIDENGVHAEDLWPEIIKYLNYEEFDLIIFGSDIMDYCSASNFNMVKDGLDSLRHEYLYIRSDHDYGDWYGGEEYTEGDTMELHKSIDGDEMPDKIKDFGDFVIIGVDRSHKDMTDYCLDMITDVYSLGKPVIMVTHVPYESRVDTSLEELSMQIRNKIYYWGGGAYVPNDKTTEYFDLIYSEDTVVKQVLAGHLHASWDGMISEQVSQHIFDPAYQGNIGIIHIVPEE